MRLLLSLVIGLSLAELPGSPSSAAGVELRVQLRESVTVTRHTVQLRDVATLTCSDPRRREQAGLVEIRTIESRHGIVEISHRTILTRLILAGWTLDQVAVSGATVSLVTFRDPQLLTDTEVEKETLRTLATMMNVGESDLSVRLQNAFVQSLPAELREADGLVIKVVPPQRCLGTVSIPVQVWSGPEIVATRSATFDVRRKHQVAVAKVSLTREVPLDTNVVQFENRFLTTDADELAPVHVLGQRVRSTVPAGSVLQMKDLQKAPQNREVVIRKGDVVRVVAVAGRLQTQLRNAEALQDGAPGEAIRLRNRDTQKEIIAMVTGPGAVKIQIR